MPEPIPRLFVVCAAALFAACATPAASTRCEAGSAYCAPSSAALTCHAGVLARCVLCDPFIGAVPGQPCFSEYEGKVQCSANAGSRLQCIQGSWVATACASGTACHSDQNGTHCR